jgi:ComF family protein
MEPVCPKCGRPHTSVTYPCHICQEHPLPLQQIRAATFYAGPVAEVLKQFKYGGYFGLAQPLGNLMLAAWPRWQCPVDLVVSIPLHTARQRERGYNQSELLARFLERHLDWQVETAALKRSRRTRPQVGLNNVERQANVRGAFIADPALVRGRQILLIDDVHTTGATLVAAAEVLLAAGAKLVSAYCLAEPDSTQLSMESF